MNNNFLITGFGRSGTKFLSKILDCSMTWEVKHEPRGAQDEQAYRGGESIPKKMINAFKNNKNYGEVNSFMRFWIKDIEVAKKGIIIRNPRDITLSIANRKSIDRTLILMEELNYFYIFFHKLLNDDKRVLKISFDKMTTDFEYLKSLAKRLGINDINWDLTSLNKVNQNKENKYKRFDELPSKIIDKYASMKWIVE